MSRTHAPFIPHLVFTLVFFILSPLHLVKENVDEALFLDTALITGLAWLGLLALAALILVDILLFAAGPRRGYRAALEALTLFVVLTGFILPLAGHGGGLTDPTDLPVNYLNLMVAIYVTGLLVFLAHKGRQSLVRLGFTLFLGANVLLIAWVLAPRVTTTPTGLNGLTQLSTGQNLLVVSLDGIPGSAVARLLQDSPGLAERFRGFTLYTDVAASSPATTASTIASLTGNRDFKEVATTEDELRSWAGDRLLTNRLLEAGFSVATYGVYNGGFRDEDRKSALSRFSPVQAIDLLNLSISRTATRLFTLRGHARQGLDTVLARLPGTGPAPDPLLKRLALSHAPAWKFPLAASLLDFQAWLDGLAVNTDRPVAQFSHFLFTHYPVEFDRNCRYQGDDTHWYEASQGWDGVLAESECALRLAGQVVDRLAMLGVLERSLVVFKSDHGKPVAYYPEGHPGAVTIHGHPLWGVGRYEPFLMIRPRGAEPDPLRKDARPFLLDDLARTLCRAEGLSACDDYPGFDLLDGSYPLPYDAVVTQFVVESSASDYRFDTHRAVTLPRRGGVVRNLAQWAEREAGPGTEP